MKNYKPVFLFIMLALLLGTAWAAGGGLSVKEYQKADQKAFSKIYKYTEKSGPELCALTISHKKGLKNLKIKELKFKNSELHDGKTLFELPALKANEALVATMQIGSMVPERKIIFTDLNNKVHTYTVTLGNDGLVVGE